MLRIMVSMLMLSFLFSAASCGSKQEVTFSPVKEIKEIKIAKTVPDIYFSALDTNFHNHQDTVYYKDHFFSGYRFLLYAGKKDTQELQSYFNGVEEGFQRKWYPDKQLAEERFYINGKKEGVHKKWWEDGKQAMLFTAYNNDYDGEFREWYYTGQIAKDFHYVKGYEEGSEKLWWPDGSIRANYVIRNGKKYGLLGLKTCMNPYDSITKK